jgi:hypothetical protein
VGLYVQTHRLALCVLICLYTLHPTPYTLHPTPYTTLHQTLQAIETSACAELWRMHSTYREHIFRARELIFRDQGLPIALENAFYLYRTHFYRPFCLQRTKLQRPVPAPNSTTRRPRSQPARSEGPCTSSSVTDLTKIGNLSRTCRCHGLAVGPCGCE